MSRPRKGDRCAVRCKGCGQWFETTFADGSPRCPDCRDGDGPELDVSREISKRERAASEFWAGWDSGDS